MTKNKFTDSNKNSKDRIVLKEGKFEEILPAVQRIATEGWNKVTLSGSKEMRRLAWLDAKLAGLQVEGYSPSLRDQNQLKLMRQEQSSKKTLTMTGAAIADDYTDRVVPILHKRFKELRREREQIDLKNPNVDHTLGQKSKKQQIKTLDKQLNSAKKILLKSLDDSQVFAQLGNKQVRVKECFEEGITRYTLSDSEKKDLTITMVNSKIGRSK